MEDKEKLVNNIMIMISGTYTPQSGIYTKVQIALFKKMSIDELHALYVMVLSSQK